ncbi:Uma2 family endonuclease [Argonema antarcticum]|uniref:Uma2 family endonuclease n=1 Tax=Argonema antarcticum TaxID=2942763 RepID=UPI002012867C|nr:Uma2 family endonuclease [Argonema antarcticum]MCL1473899.1 Uma2 family endonuclease [Argonema antarcticum A004/B2]
MDLDLILPKQKFLLTDISWDGYETILKVLQNRHVRVTYDRGNLELISPSYRHQRYKTLIGRFINILAEERNIPLINAGSTTFKRQDLERGLEPDECFYIQNASAVVGKQKIDLTCDPPPDLAIEIDISTSSLNRISIYAALGISEVWCYDGITVKVYLLREGKDGKPKQRLTFPFLALPEFMQFLREAEMVDDATVFRSFRDWVKKGFH